ncbi:MAG: hypothetical protein WEE89_04115 [Gemmatimonadota bacterium]
MRPTALILGAACAALMGATSTGSAQLAIGARAGTTGTGGEVSFGIIPRIALRGTGTVIPFKPSGTFDDVEFEVDPPSPLFTIGADLYVTNSIRLFGGLLIGADKLGIDGHYSGSVQFGNQTYTGEGDIIGAVETSSTAPFVGLGFGRTIGSGIGVNFDLGAAILGESTVRLIEITGPAAQSTQAQRDEKIAEIQDDVDKWAKYYPMISIGIRFGLGN